LLEQSAERAITVLELVSAYRTHVAELEASLGNATAGHQERGTRGAVALMRERFAERLTIQKLAENAGFAPDYFSKLLKRDEGVASEVYLQRLRMQRARQMLSDSELGIDAVAKLCGFSSRNYFHRAFKRVVGTTPSAYRCARGLVGRRDAIASWRAYARRQGLEPMGGALGVALARREALPMRRRLPVRCR
jgi:AraC-like DNA-binding protein